MNGAAAKDVGVAGLTADRTAPAGTPLRVTLGDGRTVELVLKDYY